MSFCSAATESAPEIYDEWWKVIARKGGGDSKRCRQVERDFGHELDAGHPFRLNGCAGPDEGAKVAEDGEAEEEVDQKDGEELVVAAMRSDGGRQKIEVPPSHDHEEKRNPANVVRPSQNNERESENRKEEDGDRHK